MKSILLIESQTPYGEGLRFILQMKFPHVRIEVESNISQITFVPDLLLINSNFLLWNSDVLSNLVQQGTKLAFLIRDKKSLNRLGPIENISGFLLNNMSSSELVNAIENLLTGKDYVHPLIGNWILEKYKNIVNSIENNEINNQAQSY